MDAALRAPTQWRPIAAGAAYARAVPRPIAAPAALALWTAASACGAPPDAAPGDASAPAPPDASPADAAPPDTPAPDAAAPGPDLTLNAARAIADLSVEGDTFAADACELDPAEACVGAPGDRRLLRFAVETPNLGLEDLQLGRPSADNPNYVFSECHGHYHFEGYAVYRLETPAGDLVVPGRKQAFCLLDWQKYAADDPTVSDSARYVCSFQGIQRGWSDVYEARLPCQFLDITGVPDGDYVLAIELNAEHRLPEMRYDNNVARIPVRLGDPALSGPTEPCPAEVDAYSTRGAHRECGWDALGTWECEPGRRLRIGCAAACGLGACTGDPMLRVCDPADPWGNCSATRALGANDDACGSACPRVRDVVCPASGQLAVYAAARELGAAYTCEVDLAYP
ncbi:MAG: hypothetical protein D6689_11350 [Deltaproteobacteria bacterium]|nr:MAG: hypothetical protein D6689_11350 [Deltaproteobacteria bacterium]